MPTAAISTPQAMPPDDLPEDITQSYRVHPQGEGHRAFQEESQSGCFAGSQWSLLDTTGRQRTDDDPITAPTYEGPPEEIPPVEYELKHLIGHGGMGEVWQAVQLSLNRVVAVKRIAVERAQTDTGMIAQTRNDFRREAMVAARLEHPNIVPVHDLGTDGNGNPLLAMKFVQGQNWEKMICEDAEELPFPEFLARHIPILIDVSQAVSFAHSRGVIHRDLKPSQVMVGEFGEVLLMDWGLAVFTGVTIPADSNTPTIPGIATLATAMNPSGTPAMMAPEQTEWGAARLGTHTDIYLLGGTLYFLLTQTYPHRAANSSLAFKRAALGHVESPEDREPTRELPADLVKLCMDSMQPGIAERVPSAQEFIRRLQEHLSGANRRRDSIMLTSLIASRLRYADGDYRVYSDCLTQLHQARTLWPGNEAIDLMEEQALREHAATALENGDYVLARLQAERLPEGACRLACIESIDKAEATAARHRRQRHALAYAAIGFLILHSIGALLFASKLLRDNNRTNAHLQRANWARFRAESTLSRVVTDLETMHTGDQDSGHLGRVTDRATSYYDGLAPSDLTITSMNSMAATQTSLGRTWAAIGDLEESTTRINIGISALEQLRSKFPNNREYTGQLAMALVSRARNSTSMQEWSSALRDLKDSLALTQNPGDDPIMLAARAAALLELQAAAKRGEGIAAVASSDNTDE